ncbi:hypothetical protein [Phenylobacterium sp.]|uniref:hypothetical protein n=1 Tax=Phenylobacterium sp. TaxID=1871053 RepID=UPI0011F59189|nr:hypothetical protein [Phenylobacterium sp.]THD60504.1 MAG: hypothetical protein E8A49_13795 [Phenylobacterium sp.]
MSRGRGLAYAFLTLASLLPAWVAFLSANQLMVFTTLATQADDSAPLMGWAYLARDAARVIAVCVALLIAWRAAGQARWRASWIAVAGAWAAAIALSGGLRGFVL